MSATRKKLIEVALPLDAINRAAAHERSVRHGHPCTLHLWWSRKPLAAARAVIFAQLVDDPASVPEEFPTPQEQERERKRLFQMIARLAMWESSSDSQALESARTVIRRSWARECLGAAVVARMRDDEIAARMEDGTIPPPPPFYDPFAGGGTLPLEAQRLGLPAFAGDLNPVAALINKAMIEIPPRFAGLPPVNPASRNERGLFARAWRGAHGLGEDVHYYAARMRAEAQREIERLYPTVMITDDLAADRPDLRPLIGERLTVNAWLWTRTVSSPDPAFANSATPLASTFVLSSKPGREAYVEPVVDGRRVVFTVRVVGAPGFDRAAYERAKNGTKLARGANFQCVLSGAPITGEYIRSEARAGRMGVRLMAIAAEGPRGRLFLPPTPEHEAVARSAQPDEGATAFLSARSRGFSVQNYGMITWADFFTPRQFVALTAFADLVSDAQERVRRDALAAGMSADPTPLRDGGRGAVAYAEAVATYLAFVLDRCADRWSTSCSWRTESETAAHVFARPAIPLFWNFAEANPFSASSGNWMSAAAGVRDALAKLPAQAGGSVFRADAQTDAPLRNAIISTDPPYYDTIGYASLSDFFYVWLRRTAGAIFPDLFAAAEVPKAEELVADSLRHGGKDAAERFFLEGMTHALQNFAVQAHPAFPITIYYAYKQQEASAGWETFLAAIIRAGFAIVGSWPLRTEMATRMNAIASNTLASSVVLVCRLRPAAAPVVSRREFMATLKAELPQAAFALQRAGLAPSDLAQAAVGLGMAVFSRYAAVRDATGRDMSVGEALALINRALDEAMDEQEGEFDAETRWALAWYEQYGFDEGPFGDAETLAKAKGTSVAALVSGGVVNARRGVVRLLQGSEMTAAWELRLRDGRDAATGREASAWAAAHMLIHAVETGGYAAAGVWAARLGERAYAARDAAYRAYALCERKGRDRDANAYVTLIRAWDAMMQAAAKAREAQTDLF